MCVVRDQGEQPVEIGRALVQLSRKGEMPVGWCKIRGVRRKEFTHLWSNGKKPLKTNTAVVV